MNIPHPMTRAQGDEAAELKVLIAAPRGFCAGVDRAIRIVELALQKYGAPVYVRHEIVHNRYVVDSLKAKGAIFVESLDQVPDEVPVVFSAHGVPKAVPAKAEARGLDYIDATCPLVSKVTVRRNARMRRAVTSSSSAMPGTPRSSARSASCPTAR